MKTRLFADLAAFARAACTHASHLDREVPLLPFYVREQPVGWLRPSFADLLRRWPHHFEATSSFVTLRASPDTVHGRTAAMAEVTSALAREGVIRGWRDELVSVTNHYAAPELLRVERAATRLRRPPGGCMPVSVTTIWKDLAEANRCHRIPSLCAPLPCFSSPPASYRPRMPPGPAGSMWNARRC